MSLHDYLKEVSPKSMADVGIMVAMLLLVYLPGLTIVVFFVDGWRMELQQTWRKRRLK